MRRRFTIGVRDVLEARLLPPLMQRIAREAPNVEIAAVRADRRELEGELARGSLDAAIDMLLPLSDVDTAPARGRRWVVRGGARRASAGRAAARSRRPICSWITC
jgi:DNA-binding transcriptional LysR family regulator